MLLFEYNGNLFSAEKLELFFVNKSNIDHVAAIYTENSEHAAVVPFRVLEQCMWS